MAAAGWGMLSFRAVLHENMQISAENSDLVVTWRASVEEDLSHYILKRRTRLDYVPLEIAQIRAHGPNKLYTYRDSGIYKTAEETVEYELVAVASDGRTELSVAKLQTAYTPTAVRRTWGSIKAMFQ